MSLLDRIDAWGRTAPQRLAHRSAGRVLTYGELRQRSDALAASLCEDLPDDGAPVAVVGHKEPEMLVAFLGCVKAGHPYVPVDVAMPARRVERTIELAKAALTLTPEDVAARSAGHAVPARRTRMPDDAHYIMFTSGSTGDPKGVVITSRCLDAFLDWMAAEQLFSAGETFLNPSPFSFDLSVMEIWTALNAGSTIVSLTRDEIADARSLFPALAASHATTWVSTPSFAQLCMAERRFATSMLPHLRRMLFCGETLAPGLASALLERFPNVLIWNTYGPTEATVACSSIRLDRGLVERYPALPIGRPMRPGGLRVLDDGRMPVAERERGELIIVGPNVSPGYYRNPELTRRAFFSIEGQPAYRTGDRGHVQDGLFFCDGRLDRQIKLHGYRIELGDIEAHLCALRGVREAVVVPEMRGETVVGLAAFLLRSDDAAQSDRDEVIDIRARLGERVPAYMLPRRIRFVSEFPMTPNGKIDRQQVAALPR